MNTINKDIKHKIFTVSGYRVRFHHDPEKPVGSWVTLDGKRIAAYSVAFNCEGECEIAMYDPWPPVLDPKEVS